ncbi:MAG: hypothetical protein EOO99_01060 [Pedobacter sp.]|nr:MAG: hypothetical protein EOO99_01060 [Pedobacter sp.]
MKINWGTKLVIGLASFMLFILGMGFYMINASSKDGLMADNYYEDGLQYDVQSQAIEQVFSDHVEPKIEIKAEQLIIQLAHEASYDLKILRASASQDDLQFKGKTIGDSHLIIVDLEGKPAGKWFFELKWESHQKAYYYKKDLFL